MRPHEGSEIHEHHGWQMWLAAVTILAACVPVAGGSDTQPRAAQVPPDRPGAQRYKLTIVEAALQARRPNGDPWHVRPTGDSMQLLGGLVGLALGYPELGLSMGALLDKGEHAYPPSPFVEIKIGATTLATMPAGPTLSPRWRYPVALDVNGYALSEPVVILVRDAVDEGVIAQTHVSLGALLERPFLRLIELGSVATLDIAVEPLPAVPVPETYRFLVPVDASAKWLLENENSGAPTDWRRVRVLNGDLVRIDVTGSICPSAMERTACFDAEGAAGRWRSFNYPDFASAPHGALVGLYADVRVVVGRHTKFRVEKSGWLTLFVNDTEARNNTGAFQVTVEVNPHEDVTPSYR